ncbi:flagella basal body P-ring formation protein FlgA [Paraburkholderia caballeronis]|nr:flagella basal body P-ring formation protein FlgA [Paraburkholderia caballeronis]TDV11883.1 flagella basal body P-ring formation protein FlgA [Paraburkholderia caballeronis]TDV20345.1 flagella basal body P-ring formation protein FlgA [Paraburkholderia caballeronis]
MSQPVRSRAPAERGARVPSGPRRMTARASSGRTLASAVLSGVLGCALGCVGWALAANAQAQQQEGGPVYIAGPGDRSGADAAAMNAMLQANANARAAANAPLPTPAAIAAPSRPATPPGTITIPGPGERAAADAGADTSAPQIVTIPGPGQRAVPPAANGPAVPMAAQRAPAALQRVSVAPAANRVVPVTVDAQQPARLPAVAVAVAMPRTALNAASAPAMANANAANAAGTMNNPPAAQPVPPGQQDGESVRAAALAFLQQQSAGLPGRVSITVAQVFPRGLAACTSLEPFLPPGARMWGRTTVGIRCVGERPWTLYVQARVAVQVTYYTAARPIAPGDSLAATDLLPREGDLASLPQTVITDPSQALGAVSLARIAAGLPLRTDMLRSASSVVIGQTVKLVAVGPSFTISTEGSVLNNAAPGQQVQVRTSGGQIVTGVVKDAATVEVQI